jgi:hypothetical protein
MTWTWKWNEYEIENKNENENEEKKGGQFFSTTGTAFPKYRRSSSFSFLQVPVEAKKTTNKQQKKRKNKKQNCFVAQRVLELLQTSFSKLSWAELAMEREKKIRQLFSHKEVVRNAKHVKARKT